MPTREYIDHVEVVTAIRRQNWKIGGALCMDTPEAETAVFNLIQLAAQIIHRRCVDAADAAVKSGRAMHVVEAIQTVSTVV